MSDFIVRAAGRNDIAKMSATGGQAFIEAYGHTASAGDIRRHVAEHFGEGAIRQEMQLASVQYLLADKDGACAGLVKLRDGEPPELLAGSNPLEVQQLYVATEFQRSGVGRRLLDAAVTAASDRGMDGLWLSAWTAADWANRFYLDYGFRPLGEISFVLGNSEYADYLMWLPIGERV